MGSAAAPWKSLLLGALESNGRIKHSKFLQLVHFPLSISLQVQVSLLLLHSRFLRRNRFQATIGINGRPSNRTVVFRGFEEGTDRIHIYTDSRTRKIEELKNCPFAEQRAEAWSSISPKSRLQYLGPSPGLPYPGEQPVKEPFVDSYSGPVDSFCLLVFNPDQVDYLNLKSEERNLFKAIPSFGGEKLWETERINP
ncbi:pyridoxine/pyridoxamine 5'-phosphate oxidase 2-like isoform X3 [Benincasa hispida]|uniref:pyridoxine/pyridoxamine 5'-phosphate oxidase 2-like isoform X3 n=1 Tax=Benincasa hispida TaxID=102211 RepID=UPI0019008447|nr:pyridoxine/pyridoxamine 5'-phosphate oxidase 2-like isoform X3 [Benincasa hispida]